MDLYFWGYFEHDWTIFRKYDKHFVANITGKLMHRIMKC